MSNHVLGIYAANMSLLLPLAEGGIVYEGVMPCCSRKILSSSECVRHSNDCDISADVCNSFTAVNSKCVLQNSEAAPSQERKE